FETVQRRFRQGQGFKVLPVAEVNVGKTHTGPPDRFAVAWWIDNVGRQRGENAAVAFNLMQRQRRPLVVGFGGGRLHGWCVGLSLIRVHTPARRNQKCGKPDNGTVSIMFIAFFTDVLAGFHVYFQFYRQQTAGRPVSLVQFLFFRLASSYLVGVKFVSFHV